MLPDPARGRRGFGKMCVTDPDLDQTQTGRLRTLPALDHIDGNALALRQARDAGAFQHRSVHKDIFAAPIRADKAKSLGGVVPLDRAGVLDGGSASSRMQRSLRWPASRWLLRRGAAVEAQDFRYLRAFGPGTGANLEGRTRRYAALAAALDHT